MNRESNTEEIANSGLVPQLGMMTRALWAAPVRNTLFLLSGALFLVIALSAFGQIRLNNWNQPFYDALSRRDFAQFVVQLGIFGVIAGALLVELANVYFIMPMPGSQRMNSIDLAYFLVKQSLKREVVPRKGLEPSRP